MIEWIKDLPTEKGWYWWRHNSDADPKIGYFSPTYGDIIDRGEWWPERIKKPSISPENISAI